MAIKSGAAKHFAFADIGGTRFPLLGGHVEQSATMSSSSFSVQIPMNYPNAYNILSVGQTGCNVTVESVAGSGTLIVGLIDKINIHYPSMSGGGIIDISGRDQSAKLHQLKSDETFINRMTTDIVSDLVGRVGLSPSITGGGGILAGKYVDTEWVKVTDGISYASVIHKCAEIDGANWFVSPTGGVFNYVIGNFTTNGIYVITFDKGPPIKGDFIQLSISRNIEADSTIQSTVKSWMPKQKQENEHTATIQAGLSGAIAGTITSTVFGTAAAPAIAGGAVGGSAGGITLQYKQHIPNLTQDHVQKYAQSIANNAARHALTVNAEVVGDASIRPDNALIITGTGAFDQPYQIDKILHRFGYGGYTMSITAKTPGEGRSAT